MTPDVFIARSSATQASERANYSLFLVELCDVLGVPRPEPAGAVRADNTYGFERAVTLKGGSKATTGFIDLYKRGAFVLEAKQGSDAVVPTEAETLSGDRLKRKMGTAKRGTTNWTRAMQKAKAQAERYARALPADDGWPPFLVVTDVGYCIDLYADFSGQGKAYLPFPDPRWFRIRLEDLRQEAVRERLRLVWMDPMQLDPARRSARVTRALAEKLARLAQGLETDGHSPDAVAQFLMRVLFTMFAEDVGLLPERSFTKLLETSRQYLDQFANLLQHLWQTMNAGGFSPALMATIPQFNGTLFAEADALPVSEAGLALLIEAAKADWTDVEPAIFGTLLERALDPAERHKLGAHFTPRAYVERLVLPTIVEPLRAEWQAAQAASATWEDQGDATKAREEVVAFHRRLCSLRVLDPACGSGNFLYVTLEHLKRLEGEVLDVVRGFGGQQMLDMTGGYTVTPQQLLGLEINPRAAAIADVVLWIGYLQWHFRTYGDAQRLDPPILRAYNNIVCTDALLTTDADGQPQQAPWPQADFIIGNPPFIGAAPMREALGDDYVETLRSTYKALPNSIDFVMYWWDKAARLVCAGEAERFGFIATNSLRQTFNRRVLTPHLEADEPLSLAYAIPDHPWVDGADGADVRISMTVGTAGEQTGRLVTVTNEEPADLYTEVTLQEEIGQIQADLTIGADVASAVALSANSDLSNRGYELGGSGFILTKGESASVGLGAILGLDQYIKPYRNGRDLTARPRHVLVIDLFGVELDELRREYPALFQHLYDTVREQRKKNRNKRLREKWWLHRRLRQELRAATSGLTRFIVTVETSKHRFFQFLDAEILPDNMLVCVATEDAYHLGVLSSRIHVTWALAAGGRLGVGNDPRYNKTRCFETFPFPSATEVQQATIRQLGEELDAFRKVRLAAHEKLTMTDLYNVLSRLNNGATPAELSTKEQRIHEQGLVSVLKTLHDDLDAAVAEAYGWPADLSDAAVLERLVALNQQRTEEEARGIIRYLRPAYQAPDVQQATLPLEAPVTASADRAALRHAWPKTLAEQAQAIQRVVAEASEAVDMEAVARRFHRAPRKHVTSLLDTRAALGQIQQIDATHYAG